MKEKTKTEYCCIWCHEALTPHETYTTHTGATVCRNCRGMNIPLTLWNKPCKRRHSVKTREAEAK